MVKGKLGVATKEWCVKVFSEDEVEEALFKMHPLKALDPDGLPSLSFQKYWHVVGNEVKKTVLDILNGD